jgi:hypothetical protein
MTWSVSNGDGKTQTTLGKRQTTSERGSYGRIRAPSKICRPAPKLPTSGCASPGPGSSLSERRGRPVIVAFVTPPTGAQEGVVFWGYLSPIAVNPGPLAFSTLSKGCNRRSRSPPREGLLAKWAKGRRNAHKGEVSWPL